MLTSLPYCEVTVREPTSSSGDEHDVLLEPSSGDGVTDSDVLLHEIIGNVVSILREIAALCRHENDTYRETHITLNARSLRDL